MLYWFREKKEQEGKRGLGWRGGVMCVCVWGGGPWSRVHLVGEGDRAEKGMEGGGGGGGGYRQDLVFVADKHRPEHKQPTVLNKHLNFCC